MPGLVTRDSRQIYSIFLAEIVGAENFFCPQSAGGDALRKNIIDALRLAATDTVAYVKLAVVKQSDEATSEGEELGGTNDESL